MDKTPLVLGIDGGATKSLGLLADGDKAVRARCVVGPSNQNVIGIRAAAANLAELILLCCREAGCAPAAVTRAVIGLAGAGAEHERSALAGAVNDLLARQGGHAIPIVIDTDARIALEGAFAGGPGVVVIAGTGSIVIGKTPSGSITRVGGWGRTLGDEGSGYDIGLRAIKALTKEIDGRGSAGSLRNLLAAGFNLNTREALITSVYRGSLDIPAIAPLVLDAARNDDPVGLSILRDAAAPLADQVGAVIRQFDTGGPTGVVFIGGLIDHTTVYSRILREAIAATTPSAEVREALHPPAFGAVLMALTQVTTS
ncbi:MAG: BadF/BadG/BcrA/BcrD ATPase family protein [Bacteroidota bacterium]